MWKDSSDHLSVLAPEQQDRHGPLSPVVRGEIRLLSKQLHLLKEEPESEKVNKRPKVERRLWAC